MSGSGLLVGLLNCIVLAVILGLVGAVILWVLTALGWPPTPMVQKLFMALVALLVLICFIELLVGGAPMFHVFR
jgi:hypothetical protein